MKVIIISIIIVLLIIINNKVYYLEDFKPIEIIYQIYQLLKYPITIFILYGNIRLLYTIAPDEKVASITTRKGAIFTTIGWVLATEIYSFYIGTFASYSIFYGSISNILVLLLWVYILSYIFVLGMGLNAGEYHLKQQENIE